MSALHITNIHDRVWEQNKFPLSVEPVLQYKQVFSVSFTSKSTKQQNNNLFGALRGRREICKPPQKPISYVILASVHMRVCTNSYYNKHTCAPEAGVFAKVAAAPKIESLVGEFAKEGM